MKILHVLSSLDPQDGGVSQAVKTIVSKYSWSNNQIHEVICSNEENQDFLKDLNFAVYPLGNSISPWKFNLRLLTWLRSHLFEYQVVIMHGLWHFQSYALFKVLSENTLRNPKFFIMPHGMLDPYFQRAKDRKLKAFRNLFFWRFFENKVINFSDGLLFTCEQEKLLAHETFKKYFPKNQFVVGLGVGTPPRLEFSMQEAFRNVINIRNNSFILYLSRIHPKKGLDMLIESYIQLKREGNSLPDLVIAGPGLETAYGKGLLEKAVEQIHFPGMLEGVAKWGAFYGCEAFILPSHQENFGIAVVEALACGKAVLISDQVNIWKEIQECGGGIVDKDTLEGTYNMLKRWLSLSLEERQQMGYQARWTYINHFSVEKAEIKMGEVLNLEIQ